MFFALRELELGMTTLLEKLQPILVLVFARFFLKERFPIEKSHWVFLAIGSSYVLVSPTPFHFSTAKVNVLGLGGILGAATSWALGTIIGKSVADKAIPSEHITLLRFLFGAIFLLPFFLFREALGLHVLWSIQLVAILVVAAVFSTALGYYLFYRGLADVTAGLSALLELVTPIMGIVLGVLFLNERMTLLQMLAALLLLISVYVLTKPRKFNRV